MFIAMNRFRINPSLESEFVETWKQRESYLDKVPGFRSFALLKGARFDDYVLYASHTVWESKEAFESWTKSEWFRKAHTQRSAPQGTYLTGPQLELFEAVLT